MKYIDPLDRRPSFLYCFGNFGGPFKVGISSVPKQRLAQIRSSAPGCHYARPEAIQWLSVTFCNRSDADFAERLAHAALDKFRLIDRHYLPFSRRGNCNVEWFNASLPMIANTFALCDRVVNERKHARKARALLPNAIVVDISETVLDAVATYREANPVRGAWRTKKYMSLNTAVRHLLQRGLQAEKREKEKT